MTVPITAGRRWHHAALLYAERLVWIAAGVCLLAGAVLGTSDHVRQSRRLAAFEAASTPLHVGTPDQSDWSAARRTAWAKELTAGAPPPEAVLRIPELRIEAEIYSGTTDRALDLGVGHIEGTARPGATGNVGLAGHRDGYFRRLKDIRTGQRIEVVTRGQRLVYRVESTRIVPPTAVEVLRDRGAPLLTLVTCYPFYFPGNAPERFIVSATLVSRDNFTPPPERT